MSHPPTGYLARWTRCSGVNSQNFRVGSGGRSIWPGLGWLSGPRAAPVWEAPDKEAALFGSKLGPRGILTLTPMLDLWNARARSEEHTSELQSHHDIVCRLLLEKKKKYINQ